MNSRDYQGGVLSRRLQGNLARGQTQGATTGGQNQQGNYTQHRQSRYSSMSRFQFAYTLPTEIDPNQVRANFRNGRLELHLPKAQPPAKRSVPVSVQAGSGQQNA